MRLLRCFSTMDRLLDDNVLGRIAEGEDDGEVRNRALRKLCGLTSSTFFSLFCFIGSSGDYDPKKNRVFPRAYSS